MVNFHLFSPDFLLLKAMFYSFFFYGNGGLNLDILFLGSMGFNGFLVKTQ